MAEPKDESPISPPDNNQEHGASQASPDEQSSEHQGSSKLESDKFPSDGSLNPEHDYDANTEHLIIETERDSAPDELESHDFDESLSINTDDSTETHEESPSNNGQDPFVIAAQIEHGGSAEEMDLLDEENLLQQVAGVFLLWWHWAYFEITVTNINLPTYNPPKIISAELIPETNDNEFVYHIIDSGFKLSTSKGEELYSVGMSMCKMFYTIEKMIYILIKRIKAEGIDTETEIQVTFDGHLLAQRKAFESIINLTYNVVVTNFDPGAWGESYLQIVKKLSERGYGYPSEAPRDIYKNIKGKATPVKS